MAIMLEPLHKLISRLIETLLPRIYPEGSGSVFARTGEAEAPAGDQHIFVDAPDELPFIAELEDATAFAETPSAPAGAPPVFDGAKLDELKAIMDGQKFAGLVGQFAESLQGRIERLETLLRAANWPDAAREAHDIVSVAGNVGASRLSALARDLEKSCKASNDTGCRALSASFSNEAADAMRALKAYQGAA